MRCFFGFTLVRPWATHMSAAIFHRARTGEGQYIELAQLESTVNLLGPSILRYSASGALPTPGREGQRVKPTTS